MDRLFIIPHTHYDAVVFKTRAEYLEMGLPIILHAMQALRDDPRYRFVLDQVCYIRPFLERYPEQETLFREMLADGRMQITCGMDTMADVNTPSGESFIRQVLYGKGYCRRKLGIEVTAGWALDTFGHHPQMPQLLIKAGFNSYFFARGVPYPPPEHAEFYWQGLDGSKVLALWMPYSYGFMFGSPHNIDEFSSFIRGRYEKLRAISSSSVLLGPAGVDLGEPEPYIVDLAAAYNAQPDRACDLIIANPDEFLTEFCQAANQGKYLHTITADLNPIFQGCYSSRIEVKQANRACEVLLTNVEKLDALATLLGKPVSHESIWRAWEPVLFNQFHDCICGVQVDKVHEDTMASYAYSQRLAGELLQERLQQLAAEIDTQGDGIAVIVWNLLGWERNDIVEVEVSFAETGVTRLAVRCPDGSLSAVQVLEAERHPQGGIKRARVLFIARGVPAMGCRVYHILSGISADKPTAVRASSSEQSAFSRADDLTICREHGRIENERFLAEFDLWTGAMTSLVDKTSGRELLSGQANVAAREKDGGDFWQLQGALKAGMATAGAQRQPPPQPGEAVFSNTQVGDGSLRDGPLMAEFTISHPFDSGWIRSRARVYEGIERIDLRTELTNNERYVRYRILFPTTVRGGVITHEIPFGAIERPSQELPAQNWVDYSNGDYGLTLLNKGIPGCNVDQDTMMLSVLRASQLVAYAFAGGYEPGVDSASGQELGKRVTFDYALVPHRGHWREARVYRHGMEVNTPLLAHKTTDHAGRLPPSWGLLDISPANVALSALKPGNDGTLVLRVYEAEGTAVECVIAFHHDIRFVEETNLMEDHVQKLDCTDNRVRVSLSPFEIKTLRIRVAFSEP